LPEQGDKPLGCFGEFFSGDGTAMEAFRPAGVPPVGARRR
jgi:hypothetical protein